MTLRSATARPLRRALVALGAVGLLLIATDAPAGAAAEPTERQSEVVSIEPSTDAVSVRFVGGDAYVELRVEEGHEVKVSGYDAEPYLWFAADGTVRENVGSATSVLNRDRYGSADVEGIDPRAAPDWQVVSRDGSYAWLDHRAHWMSESPPPAADPGDQILEGVIPLTVDGESVDVTVASFWIEDPGPASWIVVTLAILAGGGLMVLARRRHTLVPLVLIAGACTVAGVAAYRSLPAATDPDPLAWELPALALAAAGVGAALGRRAWVAVALLSITSGTLLVAWGVWDISSLAEPVLPTDLAAPLHRAAVALALSGGFGAIAWGGLRAVDPLLVLEPEGSDEAEGEGEGLEDEPATASDAPTEPEG